MERLLGKGGAETAYFLSKQEGQILVEQGALTAQDLLMANLVTMNNAARQRLLGRTDGYTIAIDENFRTQA